MLLHACAVGKFVTLCLGQVTRFSGQIKAGCRINMINEPLIRRMFRKYGHKKYIYFTFRKYATTRLKTLSRAVH